jgi:streptogramin lyase
MIAVFRKLLPVMCLLASAAAAAAPMGYSVNSDASPGDTLQEIDLETGTATQIGPVVSGQKPRGDIEGLALSPNDELWAVDEQELRLFRINTIGGFVPLAGDVPITKLDDRKGNDFGMTFTCSGALYVTSVASQSLYQLDLQSDKAEAKLVGTKGSLGADISALAAWGEPAQLFGLADRSLFRINPADGTTKLVGQISDQVMSDYGQAGMSFDEDGHLWAITDRSYLGQAVYLGSEILKINPFTAGATQMSTTTTGFESLAVAPPGGCAGELLADNPANGMGSGPTTAIPALDHLGLLLTTLMLLFTGMIALHRPGS